MLAVRLKVWCGDGDIRRKSEEVCGACLETRWILRWWRLPVAILPDEEPIRELVPLQ
jgi:hypothetical protein